MNARACMLALLLLAAARVDAGDGGALTMDRWDHLGCWNCHGSEGQGSRMAGTTIRKTPLPLRTFIGRVRLPIWQMPPHVPRLAPDADLVSIYQWLGGSDAVTAPPAISIDLKPGEQREAHVDIEMTVRRADSAAVRDLASLQYRVTLITHGASPETTLDERPAVTLDPHDANEARAQLRLPRPTERTVVVVEAVNDAQVAQPVIVGVGTALMDAVSAEQKRLP